MDAVGPVLRYHTRVVNDQPLQCPQCAYDLTGLPAGRACPECGLTLLPQTQVFLGRRGDGVVVHTMRVAASVWAGSALIARGARLGASLKDPLFLAHLAIAVLIGLSWWLWWRRRRPYYVLLSDEAVGYWEAGGEQLHISLDRVRSAEFNSLSKDVDLIGHDGTRVASIPDLRQRNYVEIAALCKAITNRAAQKSRAAAGEAVGNAPRSP